MSRGKKKLESSCSPFTSSFFTLNDDIFPFGPFSHRFARGQPTMRSVQGRLFETYKGAAERLMPVLKESGFAERGVSKK